MPAARAVAPLLARALAPLLALLAAAAPACRKDMSEEPAPPGMEAAPTPWQPAGADPDADAPPPASTTRPPQPAPPAGLEREEERGPPPAATTRPAEPEPGRLAGITAAHNRVREGLSIAPLTWSPELARFAQAWADALQRRGCALEHRPDRGPDAQRFGENLYSATGHAASAAEVVDGWAEEVRDFNPKTGRCKGICGHYTQIVWRASERLGCAMAACGATEVWVCNYDPPGNFIGQRPY